ncbi:MAG: HNH endonuclease [Bacteroidia bacterium]|nr:HNH endonuclease [Bacteroidia bacterium]
MAANDKEIWKPVTHLKASTSKRYAVSNKARLASYDNKIDERYVLKQHLNGGFPMVTIHVGDKTKALFAHHAVAHGFLKKPSPKHKYVLHLDYNKANNDPSNLKWATRAEQIEHSKKSPYVLAAAAHKVYTGATSKKLNEKKVIQLKNEIWNPKRKLTFKQLAAKYGIAEMNLYRIKNGELWFHVHVEGEPIFPKYKAQLKNIEFHEKTAAKVKKSRPGVTKKVAKKAAPKKVVKKVAPKKLAVKKIAKKVALSKPIAAVKPKKEKIKKDKKGKKEKKAKKKNKK